MGRDASGDPDDNQRLCFAPRSGTSGPILRSAVRLTTEGPRRDLKEYYFYIARHRPCIEISLQYPSASSLRDLLHERKRTREELESDLLDTGSSTTTLLRIFSIRAGVPEDLLIRLLFKPRKDRRGAASSHAVVRTPGRGDTKVQAVLRTPSERSSPHTELATTALVRWRADSYSPEREQAKSL